MESRNKKSLHGSSLGFKSCMSLEKSEKLFQTVIYWKLFSFEISLARNVADDGTPSHSMVIDKCTKPKKRLELSSFYNKSDLILLNSEKQLRDCKQTCLNGVD